MPTDILLVDDEPHILSILEETLSTAGFQVSTRDSGSAALVHLANHQPALMVTDLKMPGMSGLELMEKAHKFIPDTQVVILTGYGDMRSAVEAIRLGAFDYLTKPVETERLIQTLKNGAERRRLILENRSLIRSLEETNRIKTEFINGMSHEFRTPLGHILGFAQILQDTLEGLTEKQFGYLQNIQDAASRLLSMFEDILHFSVLRSGEARISPAPFSLSEFLEESLEPLKGAAAEKRLSFERGSPQPDRTVAADPEICQKAFSLLLDNAVKFSPEEGRISITTAILPTASLPEDAQEPDIAETIADGWLHIAVSDTGPGIHPQDQKRIFNLFEQGDASLDRTKGGTGLGLALARSLARIHGGTITLDSRPGEGSTFTLIVPLSES